MNRQQLIATLGSFGLVASLALAGCGDNVGPDCDASGHACTWLGLPGQTGFSKDGKHRLDTMIYWTMDTLFASDGTVWFIDWNNHLVRRVLTDGTVVSVMGWNDPVFPGDGDAAHPGAETSAAGALGTDVQLNHPTDLVELADGSILVMAWHNHKLRKIDPNTGQVWIVSGGGAGYAGDGGPPAKALYKQASRIALGDDQSVYIVDQQNERIRKLDGPTQIMSTIAGTGAQGYAGDGGQALEAKLNFEVGDNPEPSGGIAVLHDTLYIADTESSRIRSIDLRTHVITTIAGTGVEGAGGDGGPATNAQLFHPRDLEIGPDGDLYVADTDNSVIRAINLTSGEIRTVAGTGELGLDRNEGLLATQTRLNRPFGIDFDPSGNLYISDSLNSRILKVAQ